jgi:probable F420-dependent oxidoreductase
MNARDWRENARSVESMGYSAFTLPDHFGEQMSPIGALMSAADATTTLRVGSLVFDNDYRHPVVLAKEVATLDVLSGGRFDLGIGAGWMVKDYTQSGIPYDAAGIRIERLEEAVKIVKGALTGEKFSFQGKHYTINGIEGAPAPVQKPHPPILMGGGGRKMLGVAAREANIVHVNYSLSEGRINPALVRTGFAAATEEKIGWIREAAGKRFHDLEIGLTIFFATVTDDREAVAAVIAPGMGAEPKDVLEMPFFLIGTIDQLVEQLQERRERFGVSYVIVPGETAEALAPVVERLAGN